MEKKAERITITNTYYSEVAPGVFAAVERGPKTCNDASSCELKEWAFGAGIKTQFPEGSTSPTTLGELLPIDGVVTRHEVLVDGPLLPPRLTVAGKHSRPTIPIVE